MEYMSSIFSLLFFLGALLSLFWGIYIIRLDIRSNVNRTFLLICIALAIWSFGFAVANAQATLEGALFWRRFSAIGWTSIFSFVLHFLLLITNQGYLGKLGKSLFLLYIPGILNMHIFAFSNSMAMLQYNLVKIDYGWTNIAMNNGWDYFYYLYYSLYMLLSLFIVWKWCNAIEERIKKRQAKIIFLSILFTAVVSSLTDISANSFSTRALPQMAPLFILFPVWAMYYSARYYNMLNRREAEKEEIIISRDQQKDIFIKFSIGICLAGILDFMFEYFSKESANSGDLKNSLIKSGLVVSLGLAIFFIQRIKSQVLKEKLTLLVLLASIPIVTFQFLSYSSITVWVYPMIIIISSLLFNRRILLVTTTIMAIITQRVIWIMRPETYVLVDKYDFILRIGMFVLAFSLGYYINRIYIAKIKENNYQIEFQKMISDVLFEFVNFDQDSFDDKVDYLLEKIGSFFSVDRTYLFTINYNKETMTYSNEWCNSGIKEEVGTIEDISLGVFPWWIDQLNKKSIVRIEDLDHMPEGAVAEKEQLLRQGIKSLVSVPVMGAGKIYGFIGIDSVLEKKKWSEEEIKLLNIMANILSGGLTPLKTDKATEYRAYYDNLTKLPNRFLFEDRVNRAIYLSRRTGKYIAIMFIDLDSFKSVNDTIGHKGGDVLLKQVSESLAGVLRKNDMVARFGGDEFIIMLNNITEHSIVTRMADKIMKVFSDSFLVEGQEFLITASAGVAVYPEDGETSDALFKNADIAMYKAKSEGKNGYTLCTEEMKDENQMHIELSNDIAKALERDELLVYYQPQVDLLTNQITGVEALIRWRHPRRGMISPGIFIPLAEKNASIDDIGEWVLRTACLQNKKWQDMGLPHIEMAVNISAVQMIKADIEERIKKIIEETGLDPKYIELEITESIAIKEIDCVIDILNKLKKTGVSIAIDDFGTEYSSLSRLKLLPIDRIKIDKQFIDGIESNEKDRAIITVIINLAKSLDLNVLVEGVESKEQLDFVKEKKCDVVQGYYYYKPMKAGEIEEILKARL